MGIGDDIIASGMAREAQARDTRKVRPMLEKGFRWSQVWLHNPRILQPHETDDAQDLPVRVGGLRAYIAAKSARCWTWGEYRPPRGELYFSPEETEFGRSHSGRIVLEPHVKSGASPNKQWGWVRWSELASLLARRGLRVTQVGPAGVRVLEGAEHVVTSTFRDAATVLAHAHAAVLPEGGLHHAVAALGVPAVVIYGGFISPAVTGYDDQVSLFTGDGLGCGMRVQCDHCVEAMEKISPQQVAERLMEILRERMARPLAA